MLDERRVSIFRNGRNQAIRIPREFELEGSEALIHREGNRLIIEPLPAKNRLLAMLATLAPLADEFPSIDDPSAGDEDIF
jgi:antitoxin VapB